MMAPFQYWQAWLDGWQMLLQPASGARSIEEQAQQTLDRTAIELERVMNTEVFAREFARFAEQFFYWQARFTEGLWPQLDRGLRAWNLPSRSQADRLFQRIIALEGRFDEIEDDQQKMLGELRQVRKVLDDLASREIAAPANS